MQRNLCIFFLIFIATLLNCIRNDSAINVPIAEKYIISPIKEDYSHIKDPQDRWAAYGLEDYMIIQQLGCFCPHRGPFKVYVVNNQMKEVFDIESEKYYSKEFANNNRIRSVEKLFTLANSINADSVAYFQIEYDAKYGFPKLISIDFDSLIVDEEISYVTESLSRIVEIRE